MSEEMSYDLLKIKYQKVKDGWDLEKNIRENIRQKSLNFGIGYLDCAFRGLNPSDVVLIGARTGAGKTTLMTSLCSNFSAQGKRVTFFALEAGDYEIESRIKYNIFTNLYFNDPSRVRSEISYPHFLNRTLDPIFEKYETEAKNKFLEKTENITVVYKSKSSFSLKDLERQMMAMESTTDVFIIDHIHYIDTDGVNDNKDLSDITKMIRDMALTSKKPVLVVAHLRKKNYYDNSIIDSIDDFHGTSNLAKIATKVLMFSRYPELDMKEAHSLATLFTIPKFREDGSVSRFVGMTYFSLKRDEYIQSFKLGFIETDKGKQKFKIIEGKQNVPYWARGQGQYE